MCSSPSLYAAFTDPPICSVRSFAMDSPRPPPVVRGRGLPEAETVSTELCGSDGSQAGGLIGKNNGALFCEGYSKISLAVFYRISNDITEDPHQGGLIQSAQYRGLRHLYNGCNVMLFQLLIKGDQAFLQNLIQGEGNRILLPGR